MKDGPLRENSYLFARKVIRLSKFLFETQKEFVLGRQFLLKDSGIIGPEHFKDLQGSCGELIAMLAATVKKLKAGL
ncbi:MAG: hypothetical protein JNN04_12945 [Cyclobacteriaceae bacterium]|nr:hypothetical protein [Cyclobacteriaceae bacterium]